MMSFREAVERDCTHVINIYKLVDRDPRGEMKYDIFGYDPVDRYFNENEFSIHTVLSTKAIANIPKENKDVKSYTETIMNVVLAKGKFYTMKLYNSYIDSYIYIAFDKNNIYVFSEDSTECPNAYALPINLTEESLNGKNISKEIFDLIYSGIEGFMLSNRIEESE